MRTRSRVPLIAVLALAATALSASLVNAAVGIVSLTPSKPVFVVDDGVSPSGERYEHILYRTKLVAPTGNRTTPLWCMAFRWPGNAKAGTGAHCEGPGKRLSGAAAWWTAPSPRLVSPGEADSDLYIAGRTSPAVHDLRVIYKAPNGQEQDLEVDFARFGHARLAKIAKRAGKRGAKRSNARVRAARPYGVFTAFLPASVATADGLVAKAKAGDSADPDQQGHDPAATGDLGGLTMDGNHCDDWFGPFKVVAYGADGQELAQSYCRN